MLHLAAFRCSRWKSSTVTASTLVPPRPLHSSGRVNVAAQKTARRTLCLKMKQHLHSLQLMSVLLKLYFSEKRLCFSITRMCRSVPQHDPGRSLCNSRKYCAFGRFFASVMRCLRLYTRIKKAAATHASYDSPAIGLVQGVPLLRVRWRAHWKPAQHWASSQVPPTT